MIWTRRPTTIKKNSDCCWKMSNEYESSGSGSEFLETAKRNAEKMKDVLLELQERIDDALKRHNRSMKELKMHCRHRREKRAPLKPLHNPRVKRNTNFSNAASFINDADDEETSFGEYLRSRRLVYDDFVGHEDEEADIKEDNEEEKKEEVRDGDSFDGFVDDDDDDDDNDDDDNDDDDSSFSSSVSSSSSSEEEGEEEESEEEDSEEEEESDEDDDDDDDEKEKNSSSDSPATLTRSGRAVTVPERFKGSRYDERKAMARVEDIDTVNLAQVDRHEESSDDDDDDDDDVEIIRDRVIAEDTVDVVRLEDFSMWVLTKGQRAAAFTRHHKDVFVNPMLDMGSSLNPFRQQAYELLVKNIDHYRFTIVPRAPSRQVKAHCDVCNLKKEITYDITVQSTSSVSGGEDKTYQCGRYCMRRVKCILLMQRYLNSVVNEWSARLAQNPRAETSLSQFKPAYVEYLRMQPRGDFRVFIENENNFDPIAEAQRLVI